jgi:peptidoglycan/xylan/chitin deacetylase (PgdA/CDA1 family)
MAPAEDPRCRYRARISSAWHSLLCRRFARRIIEKTNARPLISFTFDDFPASALLNGGAVLAEHGIHGTYYVSMGLLGRDSASGILADADDIRRLVDSGHELGCHTFDHLDGWASEPDRFIESIEKNRAAVERLVAGTTLPTFAYPINEPRPATKKRVGERFMCCRGGGQTNNRGRIDANFVRSFFLDARNRDDLASIRQIVDRNSRDGGWLIFSTHDVQEEPSRFGCTVDLFREVVSYCSRSGATLLPVARACHAMGSEQI